ncbi:divalent metal cation transporter [Schnuerera sp. xch1]|uniref:NRAMP family divalent metal transporter n=1 Tax=Schnuerera sp. xch1 TaxID=2874283 RepID=UPI001CBF50A1|nr:NRAMP family divalent metal transporter [Schnuerera sp. xch1]MBZ2175916.1 divalent metal cation transporter [Schnuerera sp. xch1]
MNKTDKKKNLSILLGAAFLMATSAIGPGFLTQSATFTEQYKATFGFVILVTIVMSLIAQLNVWRIIGVSRLRGQDVANKVFNGLGYFLAILVAMGGLAFNIGNVGGAALGLNVLFDIDLKIAAIISGIISIIIFSSKRAGSIMDKFTQVLGGVMLILIAYVAVISHPPVGKVIKETFMPSQIPTLAILTLTGGTVGGYIIFSGGHRLVDADITGEENLHKVNKSAITGIGIATIIRILLLLAILGVISNGNSLNPSNPAASAFQISAGIIGYKIFGIVFCSAALTSIVGAAYTSISFLKTLNKFINKYENKCIIAFIIISTLIFIFVGQPAKVLVIVGSLNGLILPITLATILVASKKPDIIGDYKHSKVLFILGWIVVAITAYMGITSLSGIKQLWI